MVDSIPVQIIAHRGFSARAPENTLSAVRAAIEAGEITVVGVNRFTGTEPSPLTAGEGGILVVDPAVEARILDNLVPLRNASHADVVEYRVQIPMRYAECIAVLADGRTAKFVEPRKFLGWSSHDERRSLLFRHHGITLEVEVDNMAAERARSTVRRINLQAAFREGANQLKKFIGIDGGLIIVPAA